MVYCVESNPYMAKQLMDNYYRQGLDARVDIVPLIVDASELTSIERVGTIGLDGNLAKIGNPFYQARTKVSRVITTEFWHESFSCPALEHMSREEGEKAYRATIGVLGDVMLKDGLLFLQDLHGPHPNEVVEFGYTGENADIAREAVRWITDPRYDIPEGHIFPELREEDDLYWNEGRRQLVSSVVAEGAAEGNMPLRVLTEVAYRIVEREINGTLRTRVDRDHELHTGLSMEGLKQDLLKARINYKQGAQTSGDSARAFFHYAGIDIKGEIPAIYSVVIFRKQ